jgi:hypothetical protein
MPLAIEYKANSQECRHKDQGPEGRDVLPPGVELHGHIVLGVDITNYQVVTVFVLVLFSQSALPAVTHDVLRVFLRGVI